MRRREFIILLGGAVAWPLAARAQQGAVPVVGVLSPASQRGGGTFVSAMDAFTKGLKETGYVDGKNLKIETRWAEDRVDRLPALAAELVDQKVAVLAAVGGAPSILAAKAATSSIPIVFANASDPVKLGIVASLNRPGGNITGATFAAIELGAKRLELIRELVPNAKVIASLFNPKNQNIESEIISLEEAARTLQLKIDLLRASSAQDIDAAFATLSGRHADALLVLADALFASHPDRLVANATRERIPTVYYEREFVTAGGLIGYGGDYILAYREAGAYVGRILKGARPSDLPILLPTKYELTINLKAAKALGLSIPQTLLATSDEVIE